MATAAEKAKQLRAFTILLERAIEKGFDKAMKVVQREVVFGMPYLPPKQPAFAPPGPLARRSGGLARTVKPIKARVTGRQVTAGIQAGGSGIAYARIHELGGITGRVSNRFYLMARPYLRPIMDKNLDQINQAVLDEVIRLELKLGLR